MQPERGDVVRSVDPFKLGADKQRPWLIVNNDEHPFGDEQFVAVAISRSRYEPSLALTDDAWEIGGVPEESFVAPWSIHSPRIEDVVAWQGRVSDEFVDRTVTALTKYLHTSGE